MKSLAPILAVLLTVISLPAWAQSSSPEEFIAACRTAIQEKSPEKLQAITYTDGMSESDKKRAFSQRAAFNVKEIEEISLEPLPASFKPVYIFNGKKYEPTFSPAGLVKVLYKATGSEAALSTFNPYAVIGGHYFLLGTKSTDIPRQMYPLATESDSPNKEYRFVLVKWDDAGAKTLAYALTEITTGNILWTFPCTYKLEETDESWPLQQGQGAKVYWNSDSTRFVLDEAIYHNMGKAVVGIISEAAHNITTSPLEPSNLGIFGLKEYRIQVDRGWISPTMLSLEISGVYDSTGSVPNGQFTQNFTCETVDPKNFQFVKLK